MSSRRLITQNRVARKRRHRERRTKPACLDDGIGALKRLDLAHAAIGIAHV